MSWFARGKKNLLSVRLVMPRARELLSLSFSLSADGYDANKLLEEGGQDWAKKRRRGEQEDVQICWEGEDMKKKKEICIHHVFAKTAMK